MSSRAVATVNSVAVANDFQSGVEVVLYCAYGDESRDQTGERVYAVAGVFGHSDEWRAIAGPWNNRLDGKIFHAAECEFGYGEFAGMKQGENRKLYKDLVTLIVNSKLCGHGTVIHVRDFKDSFPNDFEHAPYLWGFADVVEVMAKLAYFSIPQGLVRITFDRNQDIEYSATEVYRFLLESKQYATHGHLFDEIAFACRRTVGIQIADLIARETMKYFDKDLGPSPVHTRISFSELRDTNRFTFKALRKPDFESRRMKVAQSKLWERANMSAYRQWLTQNGLQDSLSNRARHLHQFPEL